MLNMPHLKPLPRVHIREDTPVSTPSASTVTITLPGGSERIVHCALHTEERIISFPERQNFVMYSRRPVNERFDISNIFDLFLICHSFFHTFVLHFCFIIAS